jgi:hypothetical protein
MQTISGEAAVPTRHRHVLDAGMVGVYKGPLCNLLLFQDFSVKSWTY